MPGGINETQVPLLLRSRPEAWGKAPQLGRSGLLRANLGCLCRIACLLRGHQELCPVFRTFGTTPMCLTNARSNPSSRLQARIVKPIAAVRAVGQIGAPIAIIRNPVALSLDPSGLFAALKDLHDRTDTAVLQRLEPTVPKASLARPRLPKMPLQPLHRVVALANIPSSPREGIFQHVDERYP